MSKPWSKLKKSIEALWEPAAGLRIHCSVYRMGSAYGGTDCPRYWIAQGKTIIWDYPKDFPADVQPEYGGKYPYTNDASDISNLIRDYIDTPQSELMTKIFEDRWGLADILRCADRRIGLKRLEHTYSEQGTPATSKILDTRREGR